MPRSKPPDCDRQRSSHSVTPTSCRRPAPADRHRRAMVMGPELIVADEPVSMLDVSIRTKLLRLMLEPPPGAQPDLPVHHPRPLAGLGHCGSDNGHLPRQIMEFGPAEADDQATITRTRRRSSESRRTPIRWTTRRGRRYILSTRHRCSGDPAGLSVPPALPAGLQPLQGRGAAPVQDRRRAARRLLAGRGRPGAPGIPGAAEPPCDRGDGRDPALVTPTPRPGTRGWPVNDRLITIAPQRSHVRGRGASGRRWATLAGSSTRTRSGAYVDVATILGAMRVFVALLGVAALVAIVGRPLRLPYSVALVLVGLFAGSWPPSVPGRGSRSGRRSSSPCSSRARLRRRLPPGLDQLRPLLGHLALLTVPGMLISTT